MPVLHAPGFKQPPSLPGEAPAPQRSPRNACQTPHLRQVESLSRESTARWTVDFNILTEQGTASRPTPSSERDDASPGAIEAENNAFRGNIIRHVHV